MIVAATRELALESSRPFDKEQGLRTLASLLSERSAPYGFVSMLLAGSLARGEESLLMTSAGPQLFNDVDLVLVTDRPVPEVVVSSWGDEATRLLAPGSDYAGDRLSPLGFHVDLGVLPRSRLLGLPCTLFNYDLQSARVLAGEEVLREMPSLRAPAIPTREALLLLGNRCLSLCESAGPPERDTALWMHYHALKAVIDTGAALLILSGRYCTPQRERLPLLKAVLPAHYPSLLARWPHLVEMMGSAGDERRRLRPDIGWDEAVVSWKQARDVILDAMRCSLARVLGLPEHSPWPMLSEGMSRWWTSFGSLAEGRRLPAAAARWAGLRLVGKPRRLLSQAALYPAVPHLLRAIEPGGESGPGHHGDLAIAASCLSKSSGGPELARRSGDWRAVRDASIDQWKRSA